MKRTYRQNCALALSNDILGERWTLLIIRELLIQPCRFKDLNNILIGMGTNLLTNRLKELEAAGLIERQIKNDKRSAYQLSPRGLEAEPIVLAMIRWGNGQLAQEMKGAGEDISEFSHQDHWDLLAMKALFNPERIDASITVVFKTDEFNGWATGNKNGLNFGLGLDSMDAGEGTLIELPMTIAQLQKVLVEGGQAKKALLKTHKGLAEFIACF